jgi:hypothetical protein
VLNILFISVVFGDHNDQKLLEDTLYIIKFYGFKQYNGKVYAFFQTPQTPEVGRIKAIENDLSDSKDIIIINRGKGPGEAQGCTDFFQLGNRWYIFDDFMQRFNCYDNKGDFVDTYNLNTAVQLNTLFEHEEKIYALGGKLNNLYVYSVEIKDQEVSVSSIASIKLRESYHTFAGGVVYSGDKELLFVVDNTLYAIEKNNEFAISKKVELGKHDGYYPVIINRNEKSFIYYFVKKYYKYDYEKNKIAKVDKPGYEGSIVINGEKWIIKKENGKLVKYHINGNQR